jgi:flagella basal body P-ring formation protein FlgA
MSIRPGRSCHCMLPVLHSFWCLVENRAFYFSLLAMLLFFSLPSSAALRPQLVIALQPQVTLAHAQVPLGDVASLSGLDEKTLASLRKISLGNVLHPGLVTSLDRFRIERWLRPRLAGLRVGLNWRGAQRVEINTATQLLSGKELLSHARRAMEEWLRQHAEHSHIVEVAPVPDIALPSGRLELNMRPLADETLPTRRMRIWIDLSIDQQFIRSVALDFHVHAYRSAYVARRDLAAGSVVKRDDFEQREVHVENAGKIKSVTMLDAVSPWRMKQGLRKGAVLKQGQVAAVPDVMRGQAAILRTQNGMVVLESKVEVLQDGFTGQSVKVRPGNSSGDVLAYVIDQGVVELRAP